MPRTEETGCASSPGRIACCVRAVCNLPCCSVHSCMRATATISDLYWGRQKIHCANVTSCHACLHCKGSQFDTRQDSCDSRIFYVCVCVSASSSSSSWTWCVALRKTAGFHYPFTHRIPVCKLGVTKPSTRLLWPTVDRHRPCCTCGAACDIRHCQ